MLVRRIFFALTATFVAAGHAATTGFGARNNANLSPYAPTNQQDEAASTNLATPSATVAPAPARPAAHAGTEWLTVSFEKAEAEVLSSFQRDLPKLEEVTSGVVLYEVRTPGLPSEYNRALRNKLERVILTSHKLRLGDCASCDQSRLILNPTGQVQFEAQSTDAKLPQKVASDSGIPYLLYADLAYTPEDIVLRIRVVEFPKREIRWVREYSAADVVKTREHFIESGTEDIGTNSSLARAILGEIAFTTVVSPGVMMLPVVGGGGMLMYPSFDILIGEKYDGGHKRFGFLFGGSFSMAQHVEHGETALPFLIRIAPTLRYTFNPYNIRSTRWSVGGEIGGMISTGLATPYLGVGVELGLVERFSLTIMPMYILSGTVSGSQIFVQRPDGGLDQSSGPGLGTFGGLGISLKGSINW